MQQYLDAAARVYDAVAAQGKQIEQAAELFARSILASGLVHLFGSGHSRIMVEEMWPRYGSFPGFNLMVELSLTAHHQVVGSNGQRQAMFLENVPGLAERILRNYELTPEDSALVVSSSGCNVVPVEMAAGFAQRKVPVVALVSLAHSRASASRHGEGKRVTDFADVVLDTGAPVGDAMVRLEGMEMPIAPGSTVGGCLVINCLKAEIARRLVDAGQPPTALASGAVVGAARAAELFEQAYDEHARRVARLFARLGE